MDVVSKTSVATHKGSLIWLLLLIAGLPILAADGPPVFTNQPSSLMVPLGGTVRLAASATGRQPIAYVWQKDGDFLTSATDSALVISNATLADTGLYALVASNGDGLTRSDAARVIVHTNIPCEFPAAWQYQPTNRMFSLMLDVTHDDAGNIYAAGSEDNAIVVFKVTPVGELIWSARYTEPPPIGGEPQWARKVAVDDLGNVYVVGSAYRRHEPSGDRTDYDYLTLKFSSDGTLAWVSHYEHDPNNPNVNYRDDRALALTVDPASCAYVGGNRAILKLDPNGTLLWTNATPAHQLKLGRDGVTLLAAWGNTLSKLDTNGNLLWLVNAPWWDTRGNEAVPSLAEDAAGNIYATGTRDYDFFANRGDIETAKFAPDGRRLWTQIFDGPMHGVDAASAIAVDASGCVIVAGRIWTTNRPAINGSQAPFDAVTLKYDASGNLLWARTYNNASNRYDGAWDVELDTAGNAYVAIGSDLGIEGRYFDGQGALVKYDREGNELWVTRYRNRRPGEAGFYRVTVSPLGTVAVVGWTSLESNPQGWARGMLFGFDQVSPRLAMGGLVAPGVRQGCLVSPRGSAFEIQATTDFQSWQPVDTVTNLDGLAPFYDRDSAPFPYRAYRALRLEGGTP